MIIFATNIDRTLIYSDLFLQDAECSYQLIEKKGDRPITYVSKRAIELLRDLSQRAHIIPISLRNEEEFHRIDLFRELVIPELYVTNNGGTIYYQGEEDVEWTEKIQKEIMTMTLSHQQIKEYFLRFYKGKIEKCVNCGGLVWLFMGERDHIDEQGINHFERNYCRDDWRIDVSGKKIYVYPYFVTKWHALVYIQEKYYNEPIFAAGDSIFDLEMVERADYGMVPKACYIEEKIGQHVKIAAHKGIKAAEDILEAALYQVKKESKAIDGVS